MNKFKIILYLVLVLVIGSCANRAQGPTGGPKDETPPKVVRSVPEQGAVNFTKNVIQVFFDENIQLEKAQDNIVVSPVQITPPEIKGNGKLVTITFQDDIKDSTTYSVYFGDAIVDLNEKNALKNYNFAFSSGSTIDTLAFSGYLLQADNLEPVAKTLVGVHSNLSDTAILTLPFDRISRTNEHGFFKIGNLKPGSYKVFALGDVNRDYYYQPGESVAFTDSLIVPYVSREYLPDTLWRDSLHIDTIRMLEKTVNYPNNIVLRYFKDAKKRQYLVKSDRPESTKLQLIFNTKQDSLPKFHALNYSLDKGILVQNNLTNDTINYWLKDTALSTIDTLATQIDYMHTDSLGKLVPKSDTVYFVSRNLSRNTKGKLVVKAKKGLDFKSNINPSFDVYQKIVLDFAYPVDSIHSAGINLFHLVDSTRKSVPYDLSVLDSAGSKYQLSYPWLSQNSYELVLDSAAFTDIYGKQSEAWSGPFKIKSLEEYSAIRIVLTNADSLGILQVLDSKENVIRQAKVNPSGNLFEYLKPDSYFIRMIIDENQNGLWDSGSLKDKIHAEDVFYFPKKITLKANWEQEESWDHLSLPLLNQRPIDLRKDIKKQETKSSNKQMK